ncbi:WYL domain-containing protein [Pseudorhodobacter ferrugineus]|uniref:WYL domain-containing protein n=1 Tax=Pseudorhodobacter ferrugineus TaxID=77008 RepID=UPI0003B68477|nr:WYL domain-containing protein [Pseudorhodobacter ferrugineus]
MSARDKTDAPHTLTRRALARWFGAGAASIGLGAGTVVAAPVVDPVLRDAALRGLALVDHRADPIAAAAAETALKRLAETDPEGALLCRLYRKLDVRPAGGWRSDAGAAQANDLTQLHTALEASRPVRFEYTDLSDQQSTRTVLPLALVHPPQGVKLVAWCEKAEGYRQFFVREMRELTTQAGGFGQDRLALLQGLVEKEGA